MNKRVMSLVALVLVLLAVVVLFGRSGLFTAESPSSVAPRLVQPVVIPSRPGSESSHPVPGAPPPWTTGSSSLLTQPGLQANGQTAPAGSAASAPRDLKELEKMQQALAESVRDGKQPDPKQVLELLNQLKQKHGAVVAGVNLDAVILNLQVAQEMQVLALEMQRESEKPGGADSKKLQSYVDKLTKLQAQLRVDISVPKKLDVAK